MHRGWSITPHYTSGYGVATFRLRGPGGELRYLKLARRSPRTIPIRDECERMCWAAAWLPVPVVIGCGTDGDVEWLLTKGIDAPDATDPALMRDPDATVRALARGLRRFHSAPIDACPFDFRLDEALARIRRRVEGGLVEPTRDFHPEHAHLSARAALDRLERDRPTADDPVVCHGDYCFPNALIAGGEVVGFVDLGELGVADRWWDLAVATWSATWNVGPGFEDAFLDAYGIAPDLHRIAYYRLMYDMAS